LAVVPFILCISVDNSSRVKLPKIPGELGSDYVNATYLHGYYLNQEFVITQHPGEKTVYDFWRMVWDQVGNWGDGWCSETCSHKIISPTSENSLSPNNSNCRGPPKTVELWKVWVITYALPLF